MDEFILIFKIFFVQNSKSGKELNQLCPQTAATTFAFPSVFILLLYAYLSVAVGVVVDGFSVLVFQQHVGIILNQNGYDAPANK